jgi:adenosine tuberculosinyltransferase
LDLTTFLTLSNSQIADIIRNSGAKVCVFPINGTRRWFLLEHADHLGDDPIAAYMDISGKRHLELYRMFFDHGINTLLTPVFGPDLMERGNTYIERVGAEGLSRLAEHPDFLHFYDEYQVRVRFYGDYQKYLAETPYAEVCDRFEAVTRRTANYQKRSLLFGVFAHDATETIARLTIRYYQEYGTAPDKSKLVELYYGESIKPVDFFIGFDKFCVFDMPLVATGSEDLYFTTAPSPYLTAEQLRRILYDHLYLRSVPDQEYGSLSLEEVEWMRNYYLANMDKILGVGIVKGGIWYPELSDQCPTS